MAVIPQNIDDYALGDSYRPVPPHYLYGTLRFYDQSMPRFALTVRKWAFPRTRHPPDCPRNQRTLMR